jgi:hypothetical protein
MQNIGCKTAFMPLTDTGQPSSDDELTGDFGNEFEAISIGDDGWFRLLAEN